MLALLGGALLPLGACERKGAEVKPAASDEADPHTRDQVLASLERLNILMEQRDPSILEEFSTAQDVTLIGSQSDEVARTRPQIVALFRHLFALPATVNWEWRKVEVSSAGPVAWLFADGVLVVHAADGEQKSPYRLTGVLQKEKGRWRWRQFHGSQPESPPEG